MHDPDPASHLHNRDADAPLKEDFTQKSMSTHSNELQNPLKHAAPYRTSCQMTNCFNKYYSWIIFAEKPIIIT